MASYVPRSCADRSFAVSVWGKNTATRQTAKLASERYFSRQNPGNDTMLDPFELNKIVRYKARYIKELHKRATAEETEHAALWHGPCGTQIAER